MLLHLGGGSQPLAVRGDHHMTHRPRDRVQGGLGRRLGGAVMAPVLGQPDHGGRHLALGLLELGHRGLADLPAEAHQGGLPVLGADMPHQRPGHMAERGRRAARLDPAVDPAEPRGGRPRHAIAALRRGDVAGHRMASAASLADLLAGPAHGRLVGRREHHRSPRLRRQPRRLEADAGGRAAHDHHLPRKGFELAQHESSRRRTQKSGDETGGAKACSAPPGSPRLSNHKRFNSPATQ